MGLWSRIRKTVGGEQHTAEIQEELEFHLAMDHAGGHDKRQAHLRLGNVTRIEEETRSMGIVEWLDSALQDARYGLRQLRKAPALAVAVVLSLAIGVGANTAIFSLVDAVILKPLPVKDPDSLRVVEWVNDSFPKEATNINGDFHKISEGRFRGSSVPAYVHRRLARKQTGFETLIGVADADGVAIAVDAAPAEQVSLQYVSSNFFQGLGAVPVIGRPFRDDEDRVGAEPVVIVSDRFWKARLAGALDHDVKINNVPARIVGVAPPGFFGLMVGQWTDVYAPIATKVAFQAAHGENDTDWWVRQIGRLKPGTSETAARLQLGGLLRDVREVVTSPGRRGFAAVRPSDASALWILMLLVGTLLLIVCANVANLLLSRSVGRQRESSVRLALGAPRMRLFRQHLIESGVLAVLGGGAGLGLGYFLAQSIHFLFQTGRDASSAFDLHLDTRVMGFAGALSIMTAALFGLAPAVRAARAGLGDALKTQARSVMGGRLRLPRLLVSFQIALCLAALVAAGLLGRTLEKLKWIDIGFDRENLVYASVNPARAGYTAERTGPYVERVREELERLNGVLRVSSASFRPLSSAGNNGALNFLGRPYQPEHDRANLSEVSAGFFETLGIPLLAGRTFEPRDIHPNASAAVVDELFAKRYFPNENPLGRRFGIGPKNNSRYEIVGIVRDSRYNILRGEAVPTFFEPFVPGHGTIHFAIRSALDSVRLSEAVRKTVASVDRAVPVTEFRTQTTLIDRLLRTERLLGFLSGAFGVVALTLAAIGLGGLLAYAVARRTNEIGVRMALGAAAGNVMQMVLADSLRMVGAGILIGLPCAYGIGTILQASLFELEPLDLWTTALSLLALVGVALLAAWVPARRAARIDPITALREE